MADEVWTLGADPAELKLALGAVNKEIADNNREWAKVAKAANMSAEEQVAAASRIHAHMTKLLEEKKKLIAHYQHDAQVTGQSLQTLSNGMRVADRVGTAMGRNNARAMSQMSEGIRSVSYGVDDFLTVASQQGGMRGFANGVQAAANNFSFLLGSINPGLILLPSLAAAALKIGVNMFEASTQTIKLDDDVKKLADSYQKLQSIASKTNQQNEDWNAIMMAESQINASQANRTVLAKKVEDLKKRGGTNYRESAYGADIFKGETDIAWIDEDIAKQRKAIEAAKKRMAERKTREQIEKETERLEKQFAPTRSALSQAAEKMIGAGLSSEDVMARMRQSLGVDADFKNQGPTEEGRRAFFQKILEEATAADLNRQYAEKTQSPLERERKTLELGREQIELERARAISYTPSGKLTYEDAKKFDTRLQEIDVRIREIDIQQRQAALAEKPDQSAQKAQETLVEIRNLLQQRNLTGRGNQ